MFTITFLVGCLNPNPCLAVNAASRFPAECQADLRMTDGDIDTDADSDVDTPTYVEETGGSGGSTSETGDTGSVITEPDNDLDNDGHDAIPYGDDCDDLHATAFPGGIEVCDADDVDEDCDGGADNLDGNFTMPLYMLDADGDLYAYEFLDTRTCDNVPLDFILADKNGDGDEYNDQRDCNDNDPAITSSPEIPANGINEDCNSATPP